MINSIDIHRDYYCFITPKLNPSKQYIKILDGPLMGAEIDIKKVSFQKATKKNNFTPKLSVKYDWIKYPIDTDIQSLSDIDISTIICMIVEDIINKHHSNL